MKRCEHKHYFRLMSKTSFRYEMITTWKQRDLQTYEASKIIYNTMTANITSQCAVCYRHGWQLDYSGLLTILDKGRAWDVQSKQPQVSYNFTQISIASKVHYSSQEHSDFWWCPGQYLLKYKKCVTPSLSSIFSHFKTPELTRKGRMIAQDCHNKIK